MYRAWDKEFKEMVHVNALVFDEQVIKATYQFKKEIEQLEIIKKAIEVKSLEELQKKKEHIENVIKTLEH